MISEGRRRHTSVSMPCRHGVRRPGPRIFAPGGPGQGRAGAPDFRQHEVVLDNGKAPLMKASGITRNFAGYVPLLSE